MRGLLFLKIKIIVLALCCLSLQDIAPLRVFFAAEISAEGNVLKHRNAVIGNHIVVGMYITDGSGKGILVDVPASKSISLHQIISGVYHVDLSPNLFIKYYLIKTAQS